MGEEAKVPVVAEAHLVDTFRKKDLNWLAHDNAQLATN
jgi:hypothetical protein